MAAKTPTIAVLGSTGDGKSTLCNVLSGMRPIDRNFPVGHSIKGGTYATTLKVVKWLGGDKQIRLVDTPGLDDPAGNDNKHIKQLVEALMGIKEVDAFLIVLNGAKPRFDTGLQLVLEMFKMMLGGNFMDNAILVFTKWSFNNNDIRKRKVQGITEEIHSADWKEQCYQLFNIADVPIVYVDALHNPSDPFEFDSFKNEVEQIWQAMEHMQPYDCRNVKVVKRQLDQEKDMREEIGNQLKLTKEEAEILRQKLIDEKNSKAWIEKAALGVGLAVGTAGLSVVAGTAMINAPESASQIAEQAAIIVIPIAKTVLGIL